MKTKITLMLFALLTLMAFNWQTNETTLDDAFTPTPMPTAEPTLEPTPSVVPTPTLEPSPIIVLVTYKILSEQIFTPMCIKCHGASMRLAGVRLDKYSEAIKTTDALKRSALKGSMPPSGRRLTREESDLILEWIAQGMPE